MCASVCVSCVWLCVCVCVFVLSLLQRRLNKQRKWVLFQTMTSSCYAGCLCEFVCVCWNNGETVWLTAAEKTLASIQSPLSLKFFTTTKIISVPFCPWLCQHQGQICWKWVDIGWYTVYVCVDLLVEPQIQTQTQKAAQTSRSLSQDLMISHNDNHNILQTCVLNWPFKYINEKINQLFPPSHSGKTWQRWWSQWSVWVRLLLFDVVAKNPALKVASCFFIQPLVCIHTQITTSLFTSAKKGLYHNNTSGRGSLVALCECCLCVCGSCLKTEW